MRAITESIPAGSYVPLACDCPLCQHGGGDAPAPPLYGVSPMRRAQWMRARDHLCMHGARNCTICNHGAPAIPTRCVHWRLDCVTCDWTDGRAAGTLRP